MAFSIDTINSMTDKYFIPTLVDNFFLSSPLLFKLKDEEDPFDGGMDIRQPIAYTKSTTAGRWSGRTGTLPTTFTEFGTQAVWNIRFYYGSMVLPETEVLKNKGKAQIINYVKAQTELMETSLKDIMGADLYKDGAADVDGNYGLDGLGAIITHGVDPAPGAYGGITRVGASGSKAAPVGNAFWNANPVAINANGTVTRWTGSETFGNSTTLTIYDMQRVYGFCTVGNEQPNLIVTSPNIYNKYWSLLTSQQRQASEEVTGMAGFRYLLFNSTPVVVDHNIDSNSSIYFLNTNYLKWRPHEDANFVATPFRQPPNQWINIKFVFWMGNITCSRPNMQGKLTGIVA